MEIKNSYLMWVGAEHYSKIEDYSAEAIARGISKRMPTVEMAEALMAPGTVVFLAHDEGEYRPCAHCVGEIDCGECRKANVKLAALEDEHRAIEALGAEAKPTDFKRLDRIEAKVAEIEAEKKACALCTGSGVYKDGSGGKVKFKDGTAWDYRTYNYWLHQPKLWKPTEIESTEMCAHCGGTGRMPLGKVFGLFVPNGLEYVLPEGADEALAAELEARGIKAVPHDVVVAEPARGCGKRKVGGYYVVTRPGAPAEVVKGVLKDLVDKKAIAPEGAEMAGNFATFVKPVAIDCKRFRGLKKWGLSPAAEEEAEMILDAMPAAGAAE